MADEKQQPAKKPKAKPIHTLYEVSGNTVKRKNRTCPKCGKGNFLAQHKDRLTCGKCGYTEFSKKE
jgi:small subunit ribosomal protein S27Ae